jgi:hypothetical protein
MVGFYCLNGVCIFSVELGPFFHQHLKTLLPCGSLPIGYREWGNLAATRWPFDEREASHAIVRPAVLATPQAISCSLVCKEAELGNTIMVRSAPSAPETQRLAAQPWILPRPQDLYTRSVLLSPFCVYVNSSRGIFDFHVTVTMIVRAAALSTIAIVHVTHCCASVILSKNDSETI